MKAGRVFKNITWKQGAIYNITPESGSQLQGGADIEHHFVEEGEKNVWLQRRNNKIAQAIVEYIESAETRCCNS